ncbi:MAG: hypothetical protein E6G97_20495 [Alphaproteobacteria bacterium]|nr:MAG: hypothetical protein E6G97_20495 [Alphaproteobacteria bacterium]
MKMLIAAAVVSLGGLGLAQAMPVAPAPADGIVTLAAQGCGPGFHRNPAGHCVPDEPVVRGCRPGFRRDALGRCVPDRY